jgi:molecular chaperone GrpE
MTVFAMSSSHTKESKEGPAPEPQKGAPAEADPLAAARKEAAENRDRYLRAAADLENFRRRAAREKEELRLFSTSRLLEDLLPALDNLALALASARQPNAELGGLVGGMELLQQQLRAALAAHGLTEINPVGEPFDPHKHEAISHQPSPDAPAERVLNVVRTGYVLNGRLLRPASVVVSSGQPTKGEAG